MSKFIIHVGPGQCGSSTLQRAWSLAASSEPDRLGFRSLSGDDIRLLARHHFRAGDVIAALTALRNHEIVVFSHVILFQAHRAVGALADLAAHVGFDSTSVVGYSRRQSQFIVCAYAQWHFASALRTREAWDEVAQMAVDPSLLSGAERQLVASIANDFHSARQTFDQLILDWLAGHSHLESELTPRSVSVHVGVLPPKERPAALLADFCQRVGVRLSETGANTVANPAFDDALVEAMNWVVVAEGKAFPAPRLLNAQLGTRSRELGRRRWSPSPLLRSMQAYVDTQFAARNALFCARYDLDPSAFEPSERMTRDKLLSTVHAAVVDPRVSMPNDIADASRCAAELLAGF